MRGKSFAALAAAVAFALSSNLANAVGPVGGGGGAGPMVGAMSFSIPSGLARGGRGSSGGGTMSSLPTLPFPTNDPNHYHEIKLIGRLAKDGSGLSIDQQIVRMRVNGASIPMSINGDATSETLQFDQGDELGQVLYRLILSKELDVVGDPKLRDQIAKDAAATPPKQVLVDGFVYDRTTPYLVLVSVEDEP
jgi:hypothetical protein